VSGKHTQRVVLVFLGPSTGPFATVSVVRTGNSGLLGGVLEAVYRGKAVDFSGG
jgi:hypothetical protein